MRNRTPEWIMAFAALAVSGACHRAQPGATAGASDVATVDAPRPSELARTTRRGPAPPLGGAADVPAFLDWVGAAQADEREDGRRTLASAAADERISAGLITEVERVKTADYTRALLGLGLLGDARSPRALAYLEEFANRPLPQQGTRVDGEILEQVQQAKLEAKAVDGLAFANTPASNAAVQQIIARHPSRIVRAEAINAYLWNHGDSEQAKGELRPYVHPDEMIFLDRVRRSSGENRDAFNRKLEAFLQQHPEAQAPPLDTSSRPPPAPNRPPFEEPPPPF